MCINLCTVQYMYMYETSGRSNGTRYYYGNYRDQVKHPWPRREIKPLLPMLTQLDQEERLSVRQSKSRDIGFTGLSLLHCLHPLYEFDFLHDTVMDMQHGLPQNPVKNEFRLFCSHAGNDPATFAAMDEQTTALHLQKVYKVIDERLKLFPWTKGSTWLQTSNIVSLVMELYISEYSAGHLPKDCATRSGFWTGQYFAI